MDTLIFSAGGIKGIYYIGSLKSLINHNILNLESIQNYVCCSSGCLFGLLLNLNYSLSFIEKFTYSYNFEQILDYDDLCDLFHKNGLFSIHKLKKIVISLIYQKVKQKDVTLLKLHQLTGKDLVLKVYNYTKQQTEYINYKTNPHLKIATAICMSCCIPIFFKPIYYDNCYYIDGGFTGVTPTLSNPKYSRSFTFIVSTQITPEPDESLVDFIHNLISLVSRNSVPDHNYKIKIPCQFNLSMTDFDTSRVKDMISWGELYTDIYVYRYL